jgi:hypothetical protein
MMGVHVSNPTRRTQAHLHRGEQPLKGATRLVNPPADEQESPDQDPGERDYVGRVLHVADRALSHAKRPHRGRPH